MAEILGTGKQRSGKGSRITVGGTQLAHSKFDVTFKGDDLDTVNFESLGAGEGILGVEECDLAFGGDWDAGFNAFDNPPGLYPRDDLANVLFYGSYLDGVFWDFPYVRLRSAKNSSEVRGKVTFECSGMSQGLFDLPSGSV